MTRRKLAIGLMSGTSLDGVDAALVAIEGYGLETKVELLDFISLDMDPGLRDRILQASHPETSSVDLICSLNVEIGQVHSKAVQAVCDHYDLQEPLDFVAMHGQTIYHLPRASAPFVNSTLQIGDPSPIAFEHNVPVVFNFRMMDIAASGDGAPLVPYSEFLLYRRQDTTVLLQNIGGIGNVTVLPQDCAIEDVSAFDTGPGNMMMNAACQYYYQEAYDKDGLHARQGKLIPELLEKLLANPYFAQVPPKSTGREMFGEDVVQAICESYTNADDVIYTLTHFTAQTIADAYNAFVFPHHQVGEIIVGGGGAYNPVLMEILQQLVGDIPVLTQEDKGLSSDAKEAIAFAILGNETLHGNSSNVPSATGASRPVVLGQIQPKP